MDPQSRTPSSPSAAAIFRPMTGVDGRNIDAVSVAPFDRINLRDDHAGIGPTTSSDPFSRTSDDPESSQSSDLRLDLPKSSSRNSIFSATSPVMRPAPRLPSVLDRPGNKSIREPSSPISPINPAARKGLLFASHATESGGASPVSVISQTSSNNGHHNVDDARITSAQRPGYGRLNAEERERERERIRQTNAQIDFRLCPTTDFLLGEGRHSNVYFGSYRDRLNQEDTPRLDRENTDNGYEAHRWTLCAIKRPHSDHQSQLFALEEAFAFRRLGPHPNIVRLIKIRDEADAVPSSEERLRSGDLSLDDVAQGLTVAHGRSTSDTYAVDRDLHTLRPQATSVTAQRRMVSHPPGVDGSTRDCSASADVNGEDGSMSGKTAQEAARLVMLLELLPFSLSTFVRRNADLIDVQQWHSWALELAAVVEWMHERGCIHADLKPENILLTSDLHVKICDFNSAIFPGATPLLDGLGLGTPAYGAPELSRGVQRRDGEVKGFHYPVDIWSLGAILYSLASGVEPFRRARSMIDMLYRKRVFFESEENDRMANMSVAEGSSTAGVPSRTGHLGFDSQPASRSGSLKGRKRAGTTNGPSPIGIRPYSATHRRGPSSESDSSVASSVILTGSANRPIASKIDYLLADSTPSGLSIPQEHNHASYMSARLSHNSLLSSQESSSPIKHSSRLSHAHANVNGHHRASSLGKVQASQLRTSTSVASDESTAPVSQPSTVATRNIELPDSHHLRVPQRQQTLRPDTIRRTTSYTGQSYPATAVEAVQRFAEGSSEQKGPPTDSEQERGTLHLAVAAAFANSKSNGSEREVDRRQSDVSIGSYSSFYLDDDDLHGPAQEEDVRPYSDGAPALILPGGGRLPDEARNLLERMLNVNPDLRPTAKEVRLALQSISISTNL